jgi:competence protein ComEC
MNMALVFSLFLVVSAYNGVSLFLIIVTLHLWMIYSKGQDLVYIVLVIALLSYLSLVHSIDLPSLQTTCAKIVTHYEIGGVIEIQKQRYRTFDELKLNASSLCADIEIQKATDYQRISLDPLTRSLKSNRIMGTINISNVSEIKINPIVRFKHQLKDLIFPDPQESMFWMIHHSGLWLTSFLSIISAFLQLIFKQKKVNLILHILIVGFSWLMWDPRTVRHLLNSCARLLSIPYQKAQSWSFILIILIFPYSIISLSFLFPFVIYIMKSCRFKLVHQWIILVALQQFVFASWSIILLFAYSTIGQILWWSHGVNALIPKLNILNHLSEILNALHHNFKFTGAISGGAFFTILGLIALTQRYKYWRVVSLLFIMVLMIQPIRWLPQVHFINVGQGHATLIKYHESVLIDTGKNNQSQYMKHFLNAKHVKTLNALLITHDDEDHSGGLETLIKEKMIQEIHPHKTSWNSSSLSITSLIHDRYDESNEDSGIYLVQLPRLNILITGDAYHTQEHQLIKQYHQLKVDVYLAGHHGSKTSSHPDFIAHINPKVVIISAHSSIYGHPHQKTLRTFSKQQVLSYQLEHVGDISIYCFPWFNLVLSSGGGFAIMR